MIEKEKQFKLSNTYWICEKHIEDDDEKVRDHCHITRKFQFQFQLELQLTGAVT